jgi:hypothetical protein
MDFHEEPACLELAKTVYIPLHTHTHTHIYPVLVFRILGKRKLWFQFFENFRIKDPPVLFIWKTFRTKDPLASTFFKRKFWIKEPLLSVVFPKKSQRTGGFHKELAKNWQIYRRLFDKFPDFLRTAIVFQNRFADFWELQLYIGTSYLFFFRERWLYIYFEKLP